ncbi:ABC transporter ATP-binding protein [Dyella psychrodurans]|uniref:ABC transporter ATP-binding protein n=1 Tax=Dyella psychrodurans TaxID=1927960 RepID=A0A370WZH6_9GAMM|nr:ABC transporter ATP-binding protein [Dyella psychrodurans]RDS81440.1 ABC transporter ATP-binding protein [Dyella psychrodurans]
MHDSVRDDETAGRSESPGAPPPSGLLEELGALARAVRSLFGAQLQLLAAELGLARSAISWLLAAGLVATVTGVGFGLTVLALIGLLLAKWLHSLIFAFAVLAVLEALFLFGAIMLFRRCMHWMSLPATREEWHAIMHDTLQKAEQDIDAGEKPGSEGVKQL